MFLEKFRIPTLLGLFVLIGGLAAGVYLTMQNQILTTRATLATSPKSITITNIEDQSVTISWQTDTSISGFVTFSSGGTNQTALDDRDGVTPTTRATHHVTLSNLIPETKYQYKIVSGKYTTAVSEFQTDKSSSETGFKPIIGSVLSGENPLAEGIVYLQINGTAVKSSVIKSLGNFVIPLTNLTPVIGAPAKLIVISEGMEQASATFTMKDNGEPIGPLKIGRDLNLTDALGIAEDKDKNKDGVVNSFDLIKKPANK